LLERLHKNNNKRKEITMNYALTNAMNNITATDNPVAAAQLAVNIIILHAHQKAQTLNCAGGMIQLRTDGRLYFYDQNMNYAGIEEVIVGRDFRALEANNAFNDQVPITGGGYFI
jgi:hypothetical protein